MYQNVGIPKAGIVFTDKSVDMEHSHSSIGNGGMQHIYVVVNANQDNVVMFS